MARGSGSYGSYREWEAAQRAAERAEKKAEQERQKQARELAAAEAAARDEEAAARTTAIERRVAELEGLLRSSLTWDPRISFASLRRGVAVPPLNLGPLATTIPAPDWADFVPDPPSGLQRMFGGAKRYQDAYTQAQSAFAQAQQDHRDREADRQRKVAEARATWEQKVADARRKVEAHNARIEQLAAGVRDHDRLAVSEYVQIMLDRSPYPADFPTRRHAGYVPESSLLAVEWYLPTFDVVPEHKSFRHIKTRKAVEPTVRPPAETRRLYQSVIAQIALRTLREVFAATPEEMISTVVFNGHVDTVDPATGRRIQPPLITLRATLGKLHPRPHPQPRPAAGRSLGTFGNVHRDLVRQVADLGQVRTSNIRKLKSTLQIVDRRPTPALLPILRSQQQGEILALLLGDPDLELSLTEISERTGTPHPSVYREIERAVQAGLVTTRKTGNTRLVRANTASPYYAGLAEVLTRAFGVPAVLAEALSPVNGITAAYIYGSWAARHEGQAGQRPVADIDVLVLGNPDRDELYGALSAAERRLGRPVEATIRDPAWLESGTGAFHDTVASRPLLKLDLPHQLRTDRAANLPALLSPRTTRLSPSRSPMTHRLS